MKIINELILNEAKSLNYFESKELGLEKVKLPVLSTEGKLSKESLINGLLLYISSEKNEGNNKYYIELVKALDKDLDKNLFAKGLIQLEENENLAAVISFKAHNLIYKNRDSLFYTALAIEALANENLEKENIKGLLRESTSILEKLINDDKTYYPPYYKLGYHYKFYAEPSKAKLTWDKVLQYDPDENRQQEIREQLEAIDFDFRLEQATSYIENMKYNLAIEELQKVKTSNRSNKNYLYILGLAFRGDGELQKAIKCLKTANEKFPLDADISNELGISLIQDNEFDAAIKTFTKALELEQSYTLYFNRGLAYLNIGNIEKGYKDVKRANQLEPSNEGITQQLIALENYIKERG